MTFKFDQDLETLLPFWLNGAEAKKIAKAFQTLQQK